MTTMLQHKLAAAAFVAALTVAGCGSTTTIKTDTVPSAGSSGAASTNSTGSTGSSGATGSSGTTGSSGSTGSTGAPQSAALGGTISLKGLSVTMDVTMTKVIDPLPTDEFDTPSNGTRYVAVTFKLKNTGTNVYDDSPSNGATLITNTDDQVSPTIVNSPMCDAGASMKIAAGDVRRGCLAFEVPRREHPKTIQFTLDSGYANQTGEWSAQ